MLSRPNKYKYLTLARVAADYLTLRRWVGTPRTWSAPSYRCGKTHWRACPRKYGNLAMPQVLSRESLETHFATQETNVEFINFSPSIANISLDFRSNFIVYIPSSF